MSRASSTQLTDVRKINAACAAAADGRGRNVFADIQGEKRRIIRARRHKGVLQVRVLTSGPVIWYVASAAYTD